MSARAEHADPLLERLVLDQRPGPAPRLASARANALVQAAMNDAYASGMLGGAALEPPPAVERARKRAGILQSSWLRASTMAAAGLLMLVGGAAAAKLVMEAIWPEPPLMQHAPEPSKPQRAHALSRLPKQVVLPNEPELEAIEAPDGFEPAPIKATRRDERELDAISEDLLQAANRARAAGRFREAADTYAEVYERHPSSLSAYVAEVAAGSLELEHLDRPDRAGRLFRRALRTRPSGALDLEARQGLAFALRDLGRARDEIAVLRALVAAHPDRPAAHRARARLVELGATLKP